MTISLDYLGLGHRKWPIKDTIATLPNNEPIAIGCFDTTFGDCMPNLKKLIATGKVSIVRIQIWWDDNHKIVPLSVLNSALPRWEKLARANPNITFYISHSCEHNEIHASEVRKRINSIVKLAPSCIPVNSVWKGAKLNDVINEKHGGESIKGFEIVSTDGVSAYDCDIEAFKKSPNTFLQFLWGLRFNLREINKPDQKVPKPKDRTAIPSKEYLESVIRLAFPIGLAPEHSFTGKVIPIVKPYLYKSHSEDSQGKDDPRENRPCLIVPAKTPSLDIVTCNGQSLGKLINGGSFQGNLFRFYSGVPKAIGLYGYQIGKKAMQLSGSEFVWFRDGKNYYGPVNPAFRCGYFR